MRNTLFCLILSASFVWGQNPNVPLAQNALGTVGFYLNSSSGTAINKIVTFTGNPSKVVTITAGATSGAIGIVAGGAGTTGTATVQISGSSVPCVFDGATTAGHYVGISASVNGDCTDAGATAPSGQSLGTVLSTNAGGGTFKIQMMAASGGGGAAGTIDYQSDGTPLGAIGTLNSVRGTGVICTPSVGGSVGALQCSADIGYLSTQLGINAVNAQTGTAYTIAASDKSALVTFSNASAIAVTLPQGTGAFAAPFTFCANNIGAGTVTITPTTSTINNGAATLVLAGGKLACILTDPSGNYQLSSLGGTVSSPILAKSAGYTITSTDFAANTTFTSSGTFNYTLPASLPPQGAQIWVDNAGAGTVSVLRNGNTINGGATNISMNGNAGVHPASVRIVSDGSTGYWTDNVVSPIAGNSCTNQVVTAIAANTGAATCTTITSAYVNTSVIPAGTGAVQVTSGAVGLVSGTSSNCVLVNGTSAPCDAPGQGAVSSVTPVTATNPSSASALQQLTLTTGLLNIAGNSGGTFNYQAAGIYTVASLQTPALTWTLHACAVSACASGTDRTLFSIVTPSVVTATNNIWIIRAKIANTATGASGTLFAHATATIELTAASDLGTPSNDSNTASTAAIDLTGVIYLQLYVAASSSNAGNNVINDQSSLEPASAIGPTGATGTVTVPTPGATCTFTGTATICILTTTGTVTVPVPVAGYQFCAMNDDNVSTVITLSAIGSSARYENTARTAYGTAGTGTFVSGGAVGDMVCIIGRDSTHYLTPTFKGTWTAN